MDEHSNASRRGVLAGYKFWAVTLVGSLAISLASVFATAPAQTAVLGAFLSVLAGLLVALIDQQRTRDRRQSELLGELRVPVALAPEHELFDHYCDFAASLTGLAEHRDPAMRECALLKLASVGEQLRTLARGEVVFSATETWRTVYEQLLLSPGLGKYLSVAWVKTADYWQDRPGRQSMLKNFQAIDRGLRIERVVILRGELWPEGDLMPAAPIREWIDEQHNQGLWVSLVRESEIASEPELLCDFGIYGDRATGTQEIDDQSRTQRFTLRFEPGSVRMARHRWERLSLYATSFSDLLDAEEAER